MGQEYNKYRYSRCHMTSGTLVELLSNSFRNYGSRPMLTLYISYMALSHIPYLARWSYLGNLRKTPYAVYFKNDSLMQLILHPTILSQKQVFEHLYPVVLQK